MIDKVDNIVTKRGRWLIFADETVITLQTGAFPTRSRGTKKHVDKKKKGREIRG